MKRIKGALTAYEVMEEQVVQQDESLSGRIPSFLGGFDHPDRGQEDFDRLLNKGFFRGQPVVLSAEPGKGKTGLAAQMSFLQATHGFKVLYVTQEQTPKEFMQMYLGLSTGTHYEEWEDLEFLKEEKAFNRKKKQGKRRLLGLLGDRLQIYGKKLNTKNIVSMIEKCVEEEIYDIIYIDNFQNLEFMSDQKKFGTRTEQYDQVTRAVTQVISESKTTVVWLSQLTDRNGQKVTKYSTKLNEDAATRFEIRRSDDEKEKKKQENNGNEDEPNDIPKTIIDVKKNRKGKNRELVNNCEFVYDLERGRIGSFYLPDWKERYKEELKKQQENIQNGAFGKQYIFDPVLNPQMDEDFVDGHEIVTDEDEERLKELQKGQQKRR